MLVAPKDCLREGRGEHVTRKRPRQTHEGKTRSLPKRQSLRNVAMVTKFLDLNKPRCCKYGKKKEK